MQKISHYRYSFSLLSFYKGFFVSTTGLESCSLRPEKFSKWFSFSGGSVRFFLLWSGLFDNSRSHHMWLRQRKPKKVAFATFQGSSPELGSRTPLVFRISKPEWNPYLSCSFCHLDFVKEFPRFGRKISAKIGWNRLNIGQNSTQIRPKID